MGRMIPLARVRSVHLHAGCEAPGIGESVEVGVVVVRGRLFVRAHRGTESCWYRAAVAAGRGWIRAGAVTLPVRLSTVDCSWARAIDAAYARTYADAASELVALVLTPAARSATLQVSPPMSGPAGII